MGRSDTACGSSTAHPPSGRSSLIVGNFFSQEESYGGQFHAASAFLTLAGPGFDAPSKRAGLSKGREAPTTPLTPWRDAICASHNGLTASDQNPVRQLYFVTVHKGLAFNGRRKNKSLCGKAAHQATACHPPGGGTGSCDLRVVQMCICSIGTHFMKTRLLTLPVRKATPRGVT